MRIGDFSFVIMLDATADGRRRMAGQGAAVRGAVGPQSAGLSPALQIMAGMALYYP
jgi:hypothetical protein